MTPSIGYCDDVPQDWLVGQHSAPAKAGAQGSQDRRLRPGFLPAQEHGRAMIVGKSCSASDCEGSFEVPALDLTLHWLMGSKGTSTSSQLDSRAFS